MSWVGGKKALRDTILARFPLGYKKYVEVFGGAGWVLFHKPPGRDMEVFNDFNGDLVNLYRCVRERDAPLKEELTFMLNSRLDFDYMKKTLSGKAVLPDVRRAAYYYALIRYSYAAGVDSFGGRPHSLWRDFPGITAAAKRLQTVVIENKDCVRLVNQHDSPDTFFFLDPPYVDTEHYYNTGFQAEDHWRLAEALLSIQGKFLLTYNDHPLVWQIYDQPGIYIEKVSRLSNIAQRFKPGEQYDEVIITNYAPTERARAFDQLTLFDAQEENNHINTTLQENLTYEEQQSAKRIDPRNHPCPAGRSA